jgi:2-polyprenyl-3-methyl-5-hydroxy-6-metoxy-1,4-benzoquinol methylase
MPSRYHQRVDPLTPNNAHSFAVELVGCNRRVLELGAASGHVTAALVDRGCRVTAIELEADSASALSEMAETVIVGDLNDPELLDELEPEFDVVLAGDVLEHLLRPHDVLRRAARLLRPGGRAVVSLPHVGHADVRLALMQGTWDYNAWGLLDDTHTRFFTLKSIKQMVKQAGLVITELRRVVIPAFETELALERDAIPTDVLALALQDPEAETYQFVFAATLDNGDHRVGRLAESKHEVEREFDDLRIAHAVLRAEHACLADEVVLTDERRRDSEGRAARLEDNVAAIRAELASARADLAEARTRLRRVDGSICWQLFQRLRGAAFAIIGGERSPFGRAVQRCLRGAGRVTGVGTQTSE